MKHTKNQGIRDFSYKKDGTTSTVGNPDADREAWKEHFQNIQKGKEDLNPRVWQNIQEKKDISTWLAEPPTHVELRRCVKSMKTNKASGVDNFAAEFLKYGSANLQKRIFNIVIKMWVKATTANLVLEVPHLFIKFFATFFNLSK